MSKTHSLSIKAVAALTAASLLPGLALGAAPAKAAEKTYAYTEAGSSYVPLRALKQLPGLSIEWNAGAKSATITEEGVKATLTVGQKRAKIGDKSAVLARAPFTENGTAFIPLKFVSEQYGVEISRQASSGAILLKKDGEELRLPVLPRGAVSLARKLITVENKTIRAAGRSFSVQLATVSLMDPRVDLEIAVAKDKVGSTEELASIAKRGGAKLAINGTFFDAYTDSSTKNPYGYLFNGGKQLYKSSGDKKTVVTFDSNMLTELLPGAGFENRLGEGTVAVDGGLQAGPRLLVDGIAKLDPKGEGFRDPKILTGGGARSALGVTRDHKLLLLTVGGATIPQLASIMKAAGAWQAMNLDGGASSGLYYNGSYLTRPGRLLSNALLVRVN
ncbi:Copper amine oxidase N-terminal domain-containing protein [Paenibacillaceae bacterium GAS479]|nr:Copper amine oxidase N-terminal domain-containing protein [Paenibacillaceae bacterium GAS479]